MDQDLKKLVDKCFSDYRKLFVDDRTKDCILEDTIPILYFGDLEKYQQSNIKIITAAINPSDIEFKHKKTDKEVSDFRFKGTKNLFDKIINNKMSDKDKELYIESINQYFNCNPYTRWFGKGEEQEKKKGVRELLFAPFNASYYGKSVKNIVLHTDIASPIATKYTWSDNKLKAEAKEVIKAKGNELWMKLIEYLEPDVILMSVKESYFNVSEFGEPKVYKIYDKTTKGKKLEKPFYIHEYNYKLKSGKNIKIYNETRTFMKPFNAVGKIRVKELGEDIYKDNFGGLL